MKKVLIFSHNPLRDTEPDRLLLEALEKKGFMMFFAHYLQRDRVTILSVRPDIVVLPEIRCEYTLDFARQLKAWGIQIVVRLCEVGITDPSVEKIEADYRTAIFGNWDYSDCVDLMLAWGPKTKGLQVKYGHLPEEKIVAVGGLGFDPYFAARPLSPMIKPDYKKIVLFATGFAYADRNPEYSIPEAKPEHDIHKRVVERDIAGRKIWLEGMEKFHARFGNNWNMAVRVHGGEREETYLEAMKGKLMAIPALSTCLALQGVDAVIHCGSTLAFEAHLCNLPALNFANITPDALVAAISPQCPTIEDLLEDFAALDLKKSNADPWAVAELKHKWFGPVDGKVAERAADAIAALPDAKALIPNTWPPAPEEAKYLTPGVTLTGFQWQCAACQKMSFTAAGREMIKCPWCGIACVKYMVPNVKRS